MATNDGEFLAAGMDFLVSAGDARQAIERLVAAAASAAGSDMGSFYLLDSDKGLLWPYVTVNFPQAYAQACSTVAVGTQCCGRAVLHKTPWIVSDMWADPLFAEARDGAMAAGIRAGFSMPVLDYRGECLGALGSQFRYPYTPSAYDLERQSLFAKLIAFAIARYGISRSVAA